MTKRDATLRVLREQLASKDKLNKQLGADVAHLNDLITEKEKEIKGLEQKVDCLADYSRDWYKTDKENEKLKKENLALTKERDELKALDFQTLHAANVIINDNVRKALKALEG